MLSVIFLTILACGDVYIEPDVERPPWVGAKLGDIQVSGGVVWCHWRRHGYVVWEWWVFPFVPPNNLPLNVGHGSPVVFPHAGMIPDKRLA